MAVWCLFSTHVIELFYPGASQSVQYIACVTLFLIPYQTLYFVRSTFNIKKDFSIKLASSVILLLYIIATILQLEIKGHKPKSVLVEPALDIERETYISLSIDRDRRTMEYLVSQSGGIDIEANTEDVKTIDVTPDAYEQVAKTLQLDEAKAKKFCQQLEIAFVDNDCMLLEINPLVVTKSGVLCCADAKIQIDDNARFRQPNLPWADDSPLKVLGGNIGVIANGAGMAMSTMDTIYTAGGRPANFLDIGGGTGEEVLVKYLQEITNLPGITSIIVNIFAGITRCDDIARGIIAAKKQIANLPPLYIRLEGTNRQAATDLLANAGIGLQPDLAACVRGAMSYA
jgi:succinyl-CoA synthetase beta subunit